MHSTNIFKNGKVFLFNMKIIVKIKNVCANIPWATETGVGKKNKTVMPPSSPWQITAANAKNPKFLTHLRCSVFANQMARITVKNPTTEAIIRWPCS